MSPDGKEPTPLKRYYDIATWIITQLVFSFVVAPFIFLTLPESVKVWARVYFFGVLGVGTCYAFLLSPFKATLAKKVKSRSKPGLERTASSGSIAGGDMQSTLGLPHNPEFEISQITKAVREEVEARKRRGSTVPDVRTILQQKVEEFRRDQQGGRGTPIQRETLLAEVEERARKEL